MSYAHALLLTQHEDHWIELLMACNADAQHWKTQPGDISRQYRQEILIGTDGILRGLLKDDER